MSTEIPGSARQIFAVTYGERSFGSEAHDY
jgi:hypothetical protein